MLKSIVREYINDVFYEIKDSEFYVTFFTDAFVTSIVRWLTDKNCMEPEEYVVLLKSCVVDFAKAIVKNLDN